MKCNNLYFDTLLFQSQGEFYLKTKMYSLKLKNFKHSLQQYILTSVHWHWHSVSTLTVLTQYGYGPYSNIIFHEHYHSKRHLLKLERVHPNSNILERVHPYSNMTFKKGLFWNSNGLTPIHFAAIHGFLYILALKIDFCRPYFRW